MKKVDGILKEVLGKIKPPKKDLEIINTSLKEFLQKLEEDLKRLKIDAEVFVGGSFAKNTVIKKDCYDVDVFVRFEEGKEISKLTANALRGIEKFSVIHGSRDYFRIKVRRDFFIEVIPVKKIKNPKEAENITDLSYSHVNYIKRKIKNSRVLDEIRLAKAFCYANNCYGAESYTQGFSGYGLELLVYHYGSFLKFIKEIAKSEEKIIIDIEKKFRNKQEVLMNVNSSKLQSPIVLIDPTYKQRNALAALSNETFDEFKKACKKFLKNPSIKSFEIEKIDLEKIKQNAKKKKFEFILLEAKTDKQEGDVAGSKLLKFYKHLENEISRFFEVKNKGFDYTGISFEIPVSRTSKKGKEVQDKKGKSARYFFVVKSKKEILHTGPNVKDKENVSAFKKKHRRVFVRNKRIYAREKINFGVREFVNKWKLKNKKKMRDMSVNELKIV